jgi:transposase-like protein
MTWVGKYNATRHKIIVAAVEKGNYRAVAARLAGVHPSNLYKWLEEGANDSDAEIPYKDSRYRKLYEDVEEAEARFESKMVEVVVDAAEDGPKNWTAAMTMLERTRPERFGKRDTTVIEGGDRPITSATIHILASPEAQAQANELLKTLARTPIQASRDVPALPAPSMDDVIDAEGS